MKKTFTAVFIFILMASPLAQAKMDCSKLAGEWTSYEEFANDCGSTPCTTKGSLFIEENGDYNLFISDFGDPGKLECKSNGSLYSVNSNETIQLGSFNSIADVLVFNGIWFYRAAR